MQCGNIAGVALFFALLFFARRVFSYCVYGRASEEKIYISHIFILLVGPSYEQRFHVNLIDNLLNNLLISVTVIYLVLTLDEIN